MAAIEESVFQFLAKEVEANKGTIESTGLADRAVQEKVVRNAKAFSNALQRLSKRGLIEACREGRVILYTLTDKGVEHALEEDSYVMDYPSEHLSNPLADALKEAGVTVALTDPEIEVEQPVKTQLHVVGEERQNHVQQIVVEDIFDYYRARINMQPDSSEYERLRTWYDDLTRLGRPAGDWLMTAIDIAASKFKPEQKTIQYIIGILKSWNAYGFGTNLSQEQKKLFDLFANRFNLPLSDAARNRLLAIMDRFGLVDTLVAMMNANLSDFDPSLMVVIALDEKIRGRI